MSLAPVYLITSGLTMQAAVRDSNIILGIFSVLFLLATLWLMFASFFIHNEKLLSEMYYYSTFITPIAALIFVIGWLDTLVKLYQTQVQEPYILAFAVIGLILFLAILASHVFSATKQTKKRINKPGRKLTGRLN